MTTEDSTDLFRWRILTDEAIVHSKDDSFGVHSAFANLLYQLAQNCATPFAVGLFSGWGTGKTSVARILEERILEDNPRLLGYVYLDVWKYVSDPLKRWILLETARQLADQSVLSKEYHFEGRSLESHLEFEQQWHEESKATLSATLGPNIQFYMWMTVIAGAATALLWSYTEKIPQAIRFLTPVFAFLASAGILGLVLHPLVEWLGDYLRNVGLRRTVWQVSSKPAFSSEKFGAIFQDMVATASQQLPTGKIVFVFDNLDRCPEAVAIETIAVIKTYLDVAGCVYIVPCDQDALLKHIARSYTDVEREPNSRGYAREFLNKFFQMTLRLPAPIEFDLEGFVDKQLLDAGMSDLPPEARDVLVLGYRGETPRQIKRILNDLIGYLALATEAEHKGLLNQKELTSDLPFLTKMSLISANWPEFLDQVASDPEMWPALMTKLQASQDIEEFKSEPGLVEFLRRTRHVSRTDIRPYLYIKRVPFEKDARLRTAIESALRNGQLRQFEKEFENSEQANKLPDVANMIVGTVRRWRQAGHRVLLQNAAPMIIRAALKIDHRDLAQEALATLEFIARHMTARELQDLVPSSDLFSIVAKARDVERQNILTPFTHAFADEAAAKPGNIELFSQFLGNSKILSDQTKSSLAHEIETQYPGREPYVCNLLRVAAEVPLQNGWVVTPSVLFQIAGRVNYSGDASDELRLHILASFQKLLPPQASITMRTTIQTLLPAAPIQDPPPQLSHITAAIQLFDATSLGDLSSVASNLLTQLEGNPVQERGPWVKPLLLMLQGLTKELDSRFMEALRSSLLDPTPDAVDVFLTDLGEVNIQKLLDFPTIVDALRSESAILEGRYKLQQASAYREQHLSHLPLPYLVQNLSIYETSKPWELVIFLKNVERALELKAVTVGAVSGPILTVVNLSRSANGQTHRPVYDAFVSLIQRHPDLMDSDLAGGLADWTANYLSSGQPAEYGTFRSCLSRLSPQDRIVHIRQLVNRCFKELTTDRPELLESITTDVCSDEIVRQDRNLVRELFDFVFKSVHDHPSAITSSFLNLSDYLDNESRLNYMDRALDQLVYLEAGDQGPEQMEPFLQLLFKRRGDIAGAVEEKLGRFLNRMLSPASEKQRKLKAIEFVSQLQLSRVTAAARQELTEMAHSEDADLAAKAAQINVDS
jgi:hypothetical protein